MRILIPLLAAAVTLSAQTLTVGWISDHGICSLHGTGFNASTLGQRLTQCQIQQRVQAMVNSWNPDFLVSTGDMSNIRGNRAETYKGLLVRTATPVSAPTLTTSTLQQTVTGKASSQTIRVSGITPVGTYALNFDGSNAEVIQVTARTTTAPYTITAVFLRDHSIDEPVARNSQTITIDTTSTLDCGGIDCLTDLMLLGSARTFTAGTDLTSIVVSEGTATATVANNTEKGWKALDEVVIDGEPALNGRYAVTSGPSPTTITFATTAPDGSYTTSGMTMTTRRIVFSGNYIGFDEERFDQFESVAITPASSTSFTGTFAKSHPAGAILRGSDHITILNYIRGRGEGTMFHPTSGNHDYGGGNQDWCTGCAGNAFNAFTEYWESPAGGSNAFNGTLYHHRSYGSLVTFFSTATSGTFSPARGQQQQLHFTPLFAESTTKWNVSLLHYPLFTDAVGWRLGGDTAARSNYLWMAHPNVDIVLSGHMHLPDHVTAVNDGDGTINYATMSSSADNLTTSITGGSCASKGDCTPVWGSTSAGGNFTNTYMAGKLTITDTEFKIEYFSYLDWKKPVHTITLTKPPAPAADACAGETRLCFSGEVTVQ
jgi:hypothetical protein